MPPPRNFVTRGHEFFALPCSNRTESRRWKLFEPRYSEGNILTRLLSSHCFLDISTITHSLIWCGGWRPAGLYLLFREERVWSICEVESKEKESWPKTGGDRVEPESDPSPFGDCWVNLFLLFAWVSESNMPVSGTWDELVIQEPIFGLRNSDLACWFCSGALCIISVSLSWSWHVLNSWPRVPQKEQILAIFSYTQYARKGPRLGVVPWLYPWTAHLVVAEPSFWRTDAPPQMPQLGVIKLCLVCRPPCWNPPPLNFSPAGWKVVPLLQHVLYVRDLDQPGSELTWVPPGHF